ncbi:creatininase [Sulfolobus acidocaldarius SUSAZ]|nr:creatininase [Sulfolobus acidocaldarius SUSAZ]
MKILYSSKDDIQDKIALIPIGSLEQHGPHLPMGTDSIIAEEIAKRVEEELNNVVLLFPTVYYTCSMEHEGFPYAGVSYVTFASYMIEILNSISKFSKKAVLVIGHGGVVSVLDVVKRQLNFSNKTFKVYTFTVQEENSEDLHAGTIETSAIKVINPKLVNEDKLKDVNYSFQEGVFDIITTKESNPYGIINKGKVVIDEEKGRMFISKNVEKLKRLILSLTK